MRPGALQISTFFLKCFLFWLLWHHVTVPVHSHHLTSHSASLMPRQVGAPRASVCSCYLPSDSIQVTGLNSYPLHLQLLSLSYLCPGPYVRINKMIISIWMSLMNKSIHPKPLIILPSPTLLLLHFLYGCAGTCVCPHAHGRKLEVIHSFSFSHIQLEYTFFPLSSPFPLLLPWFRS